MNTYSMLCYIPDLKFTKTTCFAGQHLMCLPKKAPELLVRKTTLVTAVF